MDAPIKKRDLSNAVDISQTSSKKFKSNGEPDDKLSVFLSWCQSEQLLLSDKVTVGKDGSCAQYGMVATAPVEEGETLFEIPRSLLLCPETCGIAELLKNESEVVKSDSGWVPLLLCLMYETTSGKSRWKPYLNLVPDYTELDLPMFWSRNELESLLHGTGVPAAVNHDLESIEREFHSIVLPFVKRHPDVFPCECKDIELYKRLVAFIMSYSFTEPSLETSDTDSDSSDDDDGKTGTKNPPMMVPMADILNHVAKNNARLDFDIDSLKMVATKSIKMGEEVFNTYGELANWQLLHMYGFAESPADNHFDAMELSMRRVFDVLKDGLSSTEDAKFAAEKLKFLTQTGAVSDDGAFVLGVVGFLTEDEMYQSLRVMTMDRAQFSEHKEKEGWSDEDEDESRDETSHSLTFDDICKLPASWRDLLAKIGRDFLSSLSTPTPSVTDSCRQQRFHFSELVRSGQKQLLTRLLQSCASDLNASNSSAMSCD